MEQARHRAPRLLLRAAAALGIALAVSGCVVYPAYGPGWYPHRGWHHYDRY